MRSSLLSIAAIKLAMSGTVVADVIYDSKGFEEFAQDFIDGETGQDGWYGFNEGLWPLVWVGPPSQGNKSVALRLHFVDFGQSGMYRFTDDLIAEGYARVTVSFDVYRQPQGEWIGNLIWKCSGNNGTPRKGGQYNHEMPMVSRTYPFIVSYDDPWVDTEFERWTTVELTWDFQTGRASGYYDGNLVGTVPIEGLDAFLGYLLVMDVGEAPQDFHQEWAWIDNFVITAEKAACYPDFTDDGTLDLFDFLAYVNTFNADDPGADCTGDGVLDLFDFLCFVNAFNAGC
jgi:hypothetical protein